jgi:Rieske Fe-S protein
MQYAYKLFSHIKSRTKHYLGICAQCSYRIEELSPGQGAVIEDRKVAAYKDYKGELHLYTAVCTHLGCTVTWNNSEKSFDCPCHGSRFSANSGNVINGPANSGIESKKTS